jgi:hypothetical protein
MLEKEILLFSRTAKENVLSKIEAKRREKSYQNAVKTFHITGILL